VRQYLFHVFVGDTYGRNALKTDSASSMLIFRCSENVSVQLAVATATEILQYQILRLINKSNLALNTWALRVTPDICPLLGPSTNYS